MTTIKQLEAFVAISEMGSFEAAAEKLDVAQSAISRHVKELEANFAYPLFDRLGRSARLTLEGAEVLARARVVLKKHGVLIEQFIRKEALVRRVRIGVTELTALTWLPLFIDAIRRQFPLVTIDLEVEHSVPLHDRLRAGQLDVVIVPNAFETTGLVRKKLAVVRNGWFCSPLMDVPEGRVQVAELGKYPLLMQGPASGAGVLMRNWFSHHGLAPKNRLQSNSIAALGNIAVSGLGIAYLPIVVSHDLVDQGLLRTVHVSPSLPPIPYVLLIRAESATPFHRSVAAIAQALCNFDMPFSTNMKQVIAEKQASC